MTPQGHSDPIVAGAAVVLTGDWLQTALTAVLVAARQRGLNGVPASADYGQLAQALSSALSVDGREPVAAQPESWVSTREASRLLGCSERNARRIASRVGHRVGGRWVIPVDALPSEED
jgi:hypothetical protein